jgi:DNA helicase-2/ATP-dependent DNA helicase PcrA
VVFVAGLEQGLVPIAHAATEAELAEERRLLYVALTRAGEALHLSHARHRMVAGRVVERRASPWLESIDSVRRSLTGPTGNGRSVALEAISACREQLAAISDS